MEKPKSTKTAPIKKICIICREAPVKNDYWIYIWEGRVGSSCQKCADKWYTIGEYLICKAVDAMEGNGIKRIMWKDKLGRWEISAHGVTSQRQVTFMQNLLVLYRKLYPEFYWDW